MPKRHAVVTGISRGIGLAIPTALARSGVEVAIVARDAAVLEQAVAAIERATARRPTVWPLVGPAARRAMIKNLSGALPSVDILVNNAGTSQRGPFLVLDDADWRGDLELKLLAGIELARPVPPGMRERRWGRIINILSIAGKTPGPASGPTSASRAAGLALTKALSAEFAGDGITVNAICIGSVLTDQWHRMHRRGCAAAGLRRVRRRKGGAGARRPPAAT